MKEILTSSDLRALEDLFDHLTPRGIRSFLVGKQVEFRSTIKQDVKIGIFLIALAAKIAIPIHYIFTIETHLMHTILFGITSALVLTYVHRFIRNITQRSTAEEARRKNIHKHPSIRRELYRRLQGSNA